MADEMEDESPNENSSLLARASIAMRAQRIQREIKKLTGEIDHWKEEADAQERKKQTCMVCLMVALGDDALDAIVDLISFGFLASLTFPVPGLIRVAIAAQERKPNTNSLFRSILAMGIKAIPIINALPITTINVILDFLDANNDAEHAKKERESREKKLKTLKGQLRQLGPILSRLARIA